MPSPFNMPDEFVQGLLKSGESMMRAFAGMPAAGEAPTADTGGSRSSLPQLQLRYWQQQTALWMGMLARAAGQSHEPVITPERGDRRFNADEWRDNPW
jgi:polyhydroxyalkanoate synthase